MIGHTGKYRHVTPVLYVWNCCIFFTKNSKKSPSFACS